MESIVDRLRRNAARKSELDADKSLLTDAAEVIDILTKQITSLEDRVTLLERNTNVQPMLKRG